MHIRIGIIMLLLPVIINAQLTAKSLTGANGAFIGFYEFKPSDYAANPGVKHPVIIFLHGIGEKGNGTTDLYKMNCCGIPKYIRDGNPMRFYWNGKWESFIVLYPQLHSNFSNWQNFYIDEMIDYAVKHLQADSNRIVLTGLSMGGGGTWAYAAASRTNASRLAGIVPVVGTCSMPNACNIANANLPVYAIHAINDQFFSPLCTVAAIEGIKACDAVVSPNLVMYPNGGHYVWKTRAFDMGYNYQNPNIYEWFLAQNRSLPPNKKPIARAGRDIEVLTGTANIFLNGTKSNDPDGKIVRYIWKKISGPAYGIIKNSISSTPIISNLTTSGVYKYELKVVDDRAEWGLDTIKVTVLASRGLASVIKPFSKN